MKTVVFALARCGISLLGSRTFIICTDFLAGQRTSSDVYTNLSSVFAQLFARQMPSDAPAYALTMTLRSAFFSPVLPTAVLAAALGTLAFMAEPRPEDVLSAHAPVLEAVEPVRTVAEPPVAAAAVEVPAPPAQPAAVDEDPRHHVALYVNRTFRIPFREARQVTDWAVEIGEARDLDPLLILAVIGTESSFQPQARSNAGAEGLMQVMTKVHAEKFQAFGGAEAAFDPYANIVVGTDILAYLVRRTGSVRKALKWYSGAANLDTDFGYSARVLKEHSRLKVAAGGESDRAVKLHRKKKSGPAVEEGSKAKPLGFARWVSLTVAAQESMSETSALNRAEAKSFRVTNSPSERAVRRIESQIGG